MEYFLFRAHFNSKFVCLSSEHSFCCGKMDSYIFIQGSIKGKVDQVPLVKRGRQPLEICQFPEGNQSLIRGQVVYGILGVQGCPCLEGNLKAVRTYFPRPNGKGRRLSMAIAENNIEKKTHFHPFPWFDLNFNK